MDRWQERPRGLNLPAGDLWPAMMSREAVPLELKERLHCQPYRYRFGWIVSGDERHFRSWCGKLTLYPEKRAKHDVT